MSYWSGYIISAIIIWVLMTLVWLLSLKLKNTSIVDIFWGLGFVLVNWILFFVSSDQFILRIWIFNILVTIWGLRLSIHIFLRNKGKAEDFRYAAWRKQYGQKWWWFSYLQTFLVQGVLLFLISAPIVHIQSAQQGTQIGFLEILGIVIWAIGFFFEAFGDYQLEIFKRNPDNKGKLLNTGVWRFTRHPNYFGDAAQWWGFFLITIGTNLGILTIFSPIIMTYLLVNVSGVAMLEKSLIEKKSGYKEYMRTTNTFIPWFPNHK